MRTPAWLALACTLATASPTLAHPFSVENLLSLEELGRASFSPDGRWFVFELQGAWTRAPRFDQDFLIGASTSKLMVVDLRAQGAARPLLPDEAGAGDTLGAYSPDGSRLIVVRQRGHGREVGVVTLATGAVLWSGQTIEPEVWFAQARWRGNDEVVLITRPVAATARLTGLGWQARERVTAAWAASARGEVSVTALGSGRMDAVNSPASPAALVAFDVRTGQTRALASGAFGDLLIAPDGRTAALVEEAERTRPSSASTVRVGYPPRRLRLVMVDLVTGARRVPCPRCDMIRGAWGWSPDGQAMVVAARPDGDGWTGYGYWRLSIKGTASPLAPDLALTDTGGRDPRPLPAVAWNGHAPMALARRAGETRADWWRLDGAKSVRLTGKFAAPQGGAVIASQTDLILRTADGLLRLDRAGQVRGPFGGPSASLSLASDPLPGEARPAALLSADGHIALIEASGRRSVPIDLSPEAQVLAVSPTAAAVATFTRDAHGVGVIGLLSPGAPPRTAALINAGLAQTRFSAPEPVSHKGLEGAALTSWLYRPTAVDLADAKGVIVVPYPGARYARPPMAAEPGERSFDTNIQLMAAAGYVVIAPSLPMNRERDPMPGLADAMLLAVDGAIARHPELKDKPLAVWGQSYGGYGALAAGVQSPRFAAIIASAPITNLTSYYGAIHPEALASPALMTLPSELGWAEHGQGNMGGPPWAFPEKYLRNSPGLQSNCITAPVLLIYGDLDTDLNQVTTLFSALYRQGKDAQLLLYRGESHVVIGPGNVRDLYSRAFAFLDAAFEARTATGGAPPEAIRPSQ